MRAVVQRVSKAKVTVEGEIVGAIARGLCVLVGAATSDGEDDVRVIAEKIAHLRVFEDDEGKMNRSVLESGGEVLLVSQFTLLGDARKGRRPAFIDAMEPKRAEVLYEKTIAALLSLGVHKVETGRFRTTMEVELTNHGPVTILFGLKETLLMNHGENDKALRILLISPEHISTARGNTTTVMRWVEGLRARGHYVETMTQCDALPERTFDLIHGHHATHTGSTARNHAEARRIPHVISVGGTDINAATAEATTAAESEFRLAKAIIVAFNEQAQELQTRIGRELATFVVRRGVKPQPGLMDRNLRPLVGLMLGAIRPVKGQLRAIDRLLRLRRLGVDVTLRIVGPSADSAYFAEVTRLATTTHGLVSVHPPIPKSEIQTAFAATDFLWNDSDSEGGSNAVLESWALGRPVAARKAPGNSELLAKAPDASAHLFGDCSSADRLFADWLCRRFDNSVETRAAALVETQAYCRWHHEVSAEIDELLRAYSFAIGR